MEHLENNDLEKVTGGEGEEESANSVGGLPQCPKCGSTSIIVDRPDPLLTICRCTECGFEWDY